MAYFGLFTAIPLQLAALGKYFTPNRDTIVLPPEAAEALHKLHLLASQEALRCIITRNAIYHEAVMQLTEIKNRALDQDQARLDLDGPLKELLARLPGLSGAEYAATMRMAELTNLQIKDAAARRIASWETFIELYKQTVIKLSTNYRELLPLARRDIGLVARMDDTSRWRVQRSNAFR